MEKRIKSFWIAGFFLPAINATVFSFTYSSYSFTTKDHFVYYIIVKPIFKRKSNSNHFCDQQRLIDFLAESVLPYHSEQEIVFSMLYKNKDGGSSINDGRGD